MAHKVWGSATLIALVACSETAYVPTYSVSDSAGVEIVQHSQGPDDIVRLTMPAYRVGWGQELEFQHVSAGVLLSNGQAVVFDEGPNLIRVLSLEGSEVGVFGGDGEGPGEFRSGTALEAEVGDTIVVFDRASRRVSRLTLGGVVVATGRWQQSGPVYSTLVGTTPAGDLVWTPESFAISGALGHGRSWFEGPVLTSDRLGARVDTIASLPMLEMVGRGDRIAPDPFARWAGWSGYEAGFVWGQNGAAEVRWFDAAGDLRHIVRWADSPRSLTAEDWGEYREMYAARAASRGRALGEPELDDHVAEVRQTASESRPLFGQLYASRRGEVWVGDYRPFAGLPTGFLVVDRVRGTLARVEFGTELRVLDIRDQRLLGVETNEWDVQAVVVYDLAAVTASYGR